MCLAFSVLRYEFSLVQLEIMEIFACKESLLETFCCKNNILSCAYILFLHFCVTQGKSLEKVGKTLAVFLNPNQ